MSNGARTHDLFAQRMRSINEALEHSGVEGKFRRRVRRFYEYVWLSVRSKRVTREFIEELPDALRVDIVTSSYAEMLRKVPFFLDASIDCVSAIAQRLESYVFMPDELIIKEGLVGTSMFFIELGLVAVVKGRGTPAQFEVCRLGRFTFFGEIAVTSPLGSIRTSSIISITVVNLQRLTRKALEEVGNIFPNLLLSIRQVAIERRKEIGEDNRIANTVAVSALPRLFKWRAKHASAGKSTSRVRPAHARVGSALDRLEETSGEAANAPPSLPEETDPAVIVQAASEEILRPACFGRVTGVSVDDDSTSRVLDRLKLLSNKSRSYTHAVQPAGASDDPEWLQHLNSLAAALGDQHGMKLSVTSSSSSST